MKSIVFLDYHGVIRSKDTGEWWPHAIDHLNAITDLAPKGAKIVVIASDRRYKTEKEFAKQLRKLGVKAEIAGKAPWMNEAEPGREIHAWLAHNLPNRPARIVILDDQPTENMAPLERYHVRIDPKVGIEPEDIHQALKVFGSPFPGILLPSEREPAPQNPQRRPAGG